MSNKKDWRAEVEQVAEKLRDPLRMRIAVAGVALAVIYFGISEPLYGRMKQGKRELHQLENAVHTAEEVLLLRDQLEVIEPRILKDNGDDIVVAHLIEILREQSVDLMRIDAETPERLGPMKTIGVSLDLSGSFTALTRVLQRFESDPYLLRVETISISPGDRSQSMPTMQLTLKMLGTDQ
jgi:type II secretory pathway component PulM